MKKSYLLASLVMTLALTFAVVVKPAQAQNNRGQNDSTQNETDENLDTAGERKQLLLQRVEQARQAAKDRMEAARAGAQNKLEEARKRTCEQKEQAINRILNNAARHGQTRLEVFQKIEDRVKEFKQSKQINVENYDAILAEVDAKEAIAVEAVVATGVATFDCDDESTGKTFSGFLRTTIKSQNTALHDYRKSIVDLIVAVKTSMNENHETEENAESEEQ